MMLSLLLLQITATTSPPLLQQGPEAERAYKAIVMFQPVSSRATRRVFGGARNRPGLWLVTACTRVPVERGELLMLVPALTVLPNDLARDLAGRNATADLDSIVGSQGKRVLDLLTSMATGIGVAVKSPATVYVAVATSFGVFIIDMARGRAPDPTPYFAHLMPDQIPKGCGTSYVFASPIKSPKAYGPLRME